LYLQSKSPDVFRLCLRVFCHMVKVYACVSSVILRGSVVSHCFLSYASVYLCVLAVILQVPVVCMSVCVFHVNVKYIYIYEQVYCLISIYFLCQSH
jgi:hypothetical protein